MARVKIKKSKHGSKVPSIRNSRQGSRERDNVNNSLPQIGRINNSYQIDSATPGGNKNLRGSSSNFNFGHDPYSLSAKGGGGALGLTASIAASQ